MKGLPNLKRPALLVAVLVIIAVGVAYAVEIQRSVAGALVVGRVETVEETILLYSSIEPSKVPLVELNYGTVNINAFGLLKGTSAVPVFVENGGDVAFSLRVEVGDVALNGTSIGNVVALNFPQVVINPGQVQGFQVGMKLLKSPGDLGLKSTDKITFTALFKATGPVSVPVPTATPVPQGKIGGVEDLSYVQAGKRGGLPLPMWNGAYASHWDLHGAPTLHSTRAARPLFSGLVHYSWKDPRVVVCDLCEHWILADDALTYTFKLNPKAVFSNGEPATAEDVVFSLDRMVDPNAVRPRAGAIKPYYKSSAVIDDKTVELTTKFPAAAFLKFLALDYMTIVNKKHVQSTDPEKLNLPEGVLGSGAFN